VGPFVETLGGSLEAWAAQVNAPIHDRLTTGMAGDGIEVRIVHEEG